MSNFRDPELLHLSITARQNQTVLPRCLQILSRRGFTLLALETTRIDDIFVSLEISCTGPARWHISIVGLLEKLVDVQNANENTTRKQAKGQ